MSSETIPNTLGVRLAELERSSSWLARHVGVSRITAWRWVTGQSYPSDLNMRAVSRLLERNIDVLWPLRDGTDPSPAAADPQDLAA